MRFWVCCITSLLLLGCDREPPSAPATRKAPTMGVEIQLLAPLLPSHLTHVAASRNGTIYWVQEAEQGRQTVFAMADGELPTATHFSAATVLEALKEPTASGSLQSLAVGADGRLYFYFAGGKGKRLLAALGCYWPETGRTKILFDAAALAKESQMGDSLALARGSILLAGNVAWLWLRHDEGFAILSLDLNRTDAPLRFRLNHISDNVKELRLNSASEDLAIEQGKTLVYLDRKRQKIYQIDPAGEASVAVDVSNLPEGLTVPWIDDQGKMTLFVPDETQSDELLDLPLIQDKNSQQYPALMTIDHGQQIMLPRSTFTAPAKVNLRGLRLNQLIRQRSGWLGYDAPSGNLLRLRVVER